jgi:hypothetical protein
VWQNASSPEKRVACVSLLELERSPRLLEGSTSAERRQPELVDEPVTLAVGAAAGDEPTLQLHASFSLRVAVPLLLLRPTELTGPLISRGASRQRPHAPRRRLTTSTHEQTKAIAIKSNASMSNASSATLSESERPPPRTERQRRNQTRRAKQTDLQWARERHGRRTVQGRPPWVPLHRIFFRRSSCCCAVLCCAVLCCVLRGL